MKIYPSILTDSIEEVQRQVDLAKQCPETEVLQIDIVDGFFADNLTVSPQNLLEIDFGDLEIDLHLMVEEPMDMLNEIDPLLDHLPIRAVIGQIEKMTYQDDFISDLKKMGLKAGLSLDLYTPVDSIDSHVLEKLDVLQFMGIEAGFQGQKLNESVTEKIKHFVGEFSLKNRDGLPVEVIFDGGINQQNISQFLDLGLSSFAIGSTLWQATDFCDQYQAYLQMGNS
jgi:ribulose-phosphate 3-epimerase